jgi:ABC-type sugar transport system ATPase subunit
LLNDPGRGIDVGAKREVHEAIRRLAASGMSILAWSSEAEETLDLCDRVLVMRKGRVIKEIDPTSTSVNDLLLAVSAERERERP